MLLYCCGLGAPSSPATPAESPLAASEFESAIRSKLGTFAVLWMDSNSFAEHSPAERPSLDVVVASVEGAATASAEMGAGPMFGASDA